MYTFRLFAVRGYVVYCMEHLELTNPKDFRLKNYCFCFVFRGGNIVCWWHITANQFTYGHSTGMCLATWTTAYTHTVWYVIESRCKKKRRPCIHGRQHKCTHANKHGPIYLDLDYVAVRVMTKHGKQIVTITRKKYVHCVMKLETTENFWKILFFFLFIREMKRSTK